MKKILIGLLLLTISVCIILSSLGIPLGFIATIPVVDIILSAVLLAAMVCLAVDHSWYLLPYPLVIIFYVLENEIAAWMGKEDGDLINNWLVFLCGVMMSIGISLLSSSSHGKETTRLSSSSKYIDCRHFEKVYQKVSMGDCSIFFENTDAYHGDGELTVDCNMGNITVFVPAAWNINQDIQVELGNVDMPAVLTGDGPILTIKGKVKLGNVEIKYCS